MILEVIARARRRLLWNAMAAEGARAVCTGLGLLILLLLLGTDILNWHCLVMVPAATLLAGACLTWRRLPDGCAAAKLLDNRLGLRDALSTALFFWPNHPPRRFDEGMRQAQRSYASRIAASIDVREVLPLKPSRAVYAGAVLALLAGGLFGLRYGVTGRLDLRRPAAPAVTHLIEALKSQLTNLEELLKQLEPERSPGGRGSEQAKLENKNDSLSNPNSGSPSETTNDEQQSSGKQDSAMALDDPAENRPGGKDQSASAENAAPQGKNNGEQRQQDQPSASADASASDSESSLFNKARDTVANLLSAIKPQPGGGNRMDADRNARQQNAKSNGKAGAEGRQQDAAASPSQGEPQGAESQAEQGSGTGSARGAESDNQPGSGAGQNEGDKRIKQADQLAAMGKISVILGKRSKDITGTGSVEVVSGAQQLKTRYENRTSKHDSVQAKAERDEVPVELQGYVRKYFQEVRTAAARGRSTGYASRSVNDSTPVQKQK